MLNKNSLIEDHNRFKQLIKNSFDLVVLWDEKGIQHYISESCERILGFKQDELMDISIIENMIHPDDKKSVIKGFLDIIKHNTNGGQQCRHRHKNGNWVYLEIFGTNQLNNPAIKSVVLNIRDITERKKTESTLKSNYSLLRIAGETAKFGGWNYDIASKKLTWSDEIAIMREEPIGYSPDLHTGISAYTPEFRNKIAKVFKNCLENGISYDEEMRIITAKGKKIWVRTIGEAVRDEQGTIVKIQGSFQDINQRKLKDEKLRKSEQQLKELNATKDKLLSIIAHDLRNPFATIIGYSDLLANNIHDFNTTDIINFNSYINTTAVNTLALLDNLLNWAKSQTGQITFKPEKLNLSSIIKNSIDILHQSAKLKNIILNYIQPKDFYVFTDNYMVKIIIRNLVTNAVKFTKSNGTISINTTQENNYVKVTISDNGIGMSKKTLTQLFTTQTNETTSGTENEKGFGLGLLLCKEFVEKNKGKIWVESELGVGTTFYFTLPIAN
ncbi:PAS domain S-box-containing protein [Wenyingzhuangia heitensis]|uniref:histidine kinase n=1 Tax=Wenyingzhuangia heitensis TaxID=1487859 RepID=A0ABX0U8Z4_9FLAO|nr:PAS domain-containing sensor histidine kinase [Wenyingzhuangia heitensis]NIJ45218.1 PAS domain S-box-containing protein [Wenyingzhuangia heitensis]